MTDSVTRNMQAGASLVAFFAMFIMLTGTYYLPTFLCVVSLCIEEKEDGLTHA